jgi:hypothetical protein
MEQKNLQQETLIYEKKDIQTILKEAEDINCELCAEEVLNWIEHNVENFIDNQKYDFRLDLPISNDIDALPETRKLQNLYRAIPEDDTFIPEGLTDEQINNLLESNIDVDAIVKCKQELDIVTNNIFSSMKENSELLEKLFERMSFYYELQEIKDGDMIISEVNGKVHILTFDYDNFPVHVSVTSTTDATSLKYYTIPDGFSISLALELKKEPQAIF